MEASDSLSRTLGMDFFIPFLFPNFGNGFFSFPSRSQTLGMEIFHSLPVPKLTISKSGIKRENGRFFPEPLPYFPNISQHFQSVLIIVIFSFHSRSRSRPFPGIIASDSRSRISGTFFFIPFPFPNFGNAFFHSFPVPEFWEWNFQFPSRSQTLGMEFSIPVPEPSKVIPAHPCVGIKNIFYGEHSNNRPLHVEVNI